MAVPVLYSFRRCPYAIRARLALAAAGLQPRRDLELREVALRAKPPELRAASPKATVPVLVQSDGAVLEQSLEIMEWALQRRDPGGRLQSWDAAAGAAIEELIAENDGPFKQRLDRTKYAADPEERQQARAAALVILRGWSRRLERGGWLLGPRPSLADGALLPFVRQFRLVDPEAFDAEPDLAPLQAWLVRFLGSPELAAVMDPPWASRSPWRSPQWLYHLALRQDWQDARREGVYACSTRGRSLAQEGFIHLSEAHQVPATAARFYADLPAGAVLLLHLDPQRLAAAGLPLRREPAPGSGERFPHLYGPLPLEAVLLAEPYRP